MQRATVIVLERDGRWAVAWRRALAMTETAASGSHEPVQVRETRLVDEFQTALKDQPTAFAAIEVAACHADQVVALLQTVARRHPRIAIAVMTGTNADAEVAAWWREVGACAVITSYLDLISTARSARQHFARFAADRLIDESLTLRERIDVRLPWTKHASVSLSNKPN